MPPDALSNTIKELLRARIDKGQLEVPMLPEVAGKVLRLTQDPDSEASDLSRLIQSDQTLAGNVMRIANSAAYSPNSQMVSLQQAITRLGMRVVAEIAISASVNSSMFNAPGYEKHINYEIRYSLASGLWAKEVARACRKNVEAAFLSGLLHDIGRPVTVQSVIEIAKENKFNPTKDDVFNLEEEFQQEIGLRVLEKWEMASSVISSVRYFNDYSEPHPAQLQTMIVVAGAKVADYFLCEADRGKTCITEEELKSATVFGDLNLYPDQVDELLEREAAVVSALEAMTT